MKRMTVVLCVLAATLGFLSGPAAEPSSDPITVRIAPTSFREGAVRTIVLSGSADHFHVVITNVSGKPIRLWRNLCSWGYRCLSFEIRGPDGKTLTVEKQNRAWTKNAPVWDTIPAGDHKVFDVSWYDSTWAGVPPLTDRPAQFLSMKAIYEVPVDKQATAHQVWTGRVTSPQATYSINPPRR